MHTVNFIGRYARSLTGGGTLSLTFFNDHLAQTDMAMRRAAAVAVIQRLLIVKTLLASSGRSERPFK